MPKAEAVSLNVFNRPFESRALGVSNPKIISTAVISLTNLSSVTNAAGAPQRSKEIL
jgi:hypothetical protein